jgi:hypothetical protein
MAKEPESQPPEIASKLVGLSNKLHSLASSLSQHIEAFEQWINSLKGKVPVTVWAPNRDNSGLLQGVRVARSRGLWFIEHGTVGEALPGDEPDPEWQRLRDAPLEVKIAAVDLFPVLVRQLMGEQEGQINRINRAMSKLIEIEQMLGIAVKEGK